MWKKLEEKSIKTLETMFYPKNVNGQKHYPSFCAIITLDKRGVNPRPLLNPYLLKPWLKGGLSKCANHELTLGQS
jgi:hypothetical protein